MNERINELVGQAKFMSEEELNRQISYNAELKAFAEKFAELIVRECVDVLQKRCPSVRHVSDEIEVKHCMIDIKEHFGVE